MGLDYKKLGLRCGIEIHQQLNTTKLFCSCPSLLRDDDPDIFVTRKLRAVMGETGEIDVAAKAEMEKKNHFIYQAYSDTTCLVELDEEPPHLMDAEALDASLQASLMMNAKIVDEVQIMRKTVVDGSNTTGFQRTALVARNGYFETSEGRVGIPTISIEEDSAKAIERHPDHVVYRLDRLGIPLIEIGTDPDIHSPEQCKEAAAYIGMVLRSTGRVKRGLGTIRQDVNVSIKEGARIEIKGAQDLKMIPTLVEFEVMRQVGLVEVEKEFKKRKIDTDYNNFLTANQEHVTETLKDTKCKFVNKTIKEGNVAIAFKLKCFAGLLGKELQPGRRLGSEFSDYAKIKTGIGGIIHSDEKLEKYNFSEQEISKIKKILDVRENDAFVIIASDLNRARDAAKEVCIRASRCGEGVIKEVRKANADGTTSYMRPMPGAARLYPETDTLPIRTDVSHVELPELLTDKAARFVKAHGLGQDLANLLVRSGYFDLFESSVEAYAGVKPAFIAETLLSTPKTVKKKTGKDFEPTDEQFTEVFSALDKGKISKDAVFDVFVDIANGKFDLSKYELLSDGKIVDILKRVIADNKDAPFNALIGKAMAALKGKADGKKVMELLKKLVA